MTGRYEELKTLCEAPLVQQGQSKKSEAHQHDRTRLGKELDIHQKAARVIVIRAAAHCCRHPDEGCSIRKTEKQPCCPNRCVNNNLHPVVVPPAVANEIHLAELDSRVRRIIVVEGFIEDRRYRGDTRCTGAEKHEGHEELPACKLYSRKPVARSR